MVSTPDIDLGTTRMTYQKSVYHVLTPPHCNAPDDSLHHTRGGLDGSAEEVTQVKIVNLVSPPEIQAAAHRHLGTRLRPMAIKVEIGRTAAIFCT